MYILSTSLWLGWMGERWEPQNRGPNRGHCPRRAVHSGSRIMPGSSPTEDLIAAAKKVTPLSQTAAEKITKLREWSKGRASPATAAETVVEMPKARAGGRAIDI